MRAVESNQLNWSAVGAQAQFALSGGNYAATAHATWGGGNAQLQVLGPDGATWLNVGSTITADGISTYANLPPASYRWNITTTTAGFVNLTRVPND